MKTRSKLLLAAVSLLTVSVAATATSAYAWYTANRQVQASVTQMGVSSTTGSLTIARPSDAVDSFTLIGSQTTPKSETPSGSTTPAYTGSLNGVALTDVSSKGLGDFAKPKFGADGSTIVGHHTITNAATAKKGGDTVTIASDVSVYGVVTMEFEIQNATSNTNADDLNVYISSAAFTTGDSGTSNKANVINAARFSIIGLEDTDSTTEPYLYCNPTGNELLKYFDSTDDKVKYLATGTATNEEGAEATATTDQGNATWIQDTSTGKLFASGHADVTNPSDNSKNNGFLCNIAATKSHKFLLTMWIEGTDPQCELDTGVGSNDGTNITLETNLSLSISLYALSSAKN